MKRRQSYPRYTAAGKDGTGWRETTAEVKFLSMTTRIEPTLLRVDVRIDGRPAHFYAFEGPHIELRSWTTGDIGGLFASELEPGLSGLDLALEKIEVKFGSIDVIAFLLDYAPQITVTGAIALGGIVLDRTRNILMDGMIKRVGWSLWRRMSGASPFQQEVDEIEPTFSGDLLALGQRVAAQEAVLAGSVPRLIGSPERLKKGYKMTFALEGRSAGHLVVTAHYDGRGYELRQ